MEFLDLMNIISAPWKYSIDDIIEKYQVSLKQGLSASEVSKRKQKYGKNILKEKEKKSIWQILLNQVKSIIMALLVVAALVSFLFGEIIQALAIVAVIIVTIIIGFSTELRAIRSMESLKDIAQVNAVVKREGSIQKISAKQLVPGDIVIFDSGDIVTADLRLFEANKLQSDESALTGESVPVSKSTQTLPEDTSLEERENMLFKGTMITKGSGKGIVVSTGMETELGKISTLVEEAEEEITPLEERIKILGRKLVWVTLFITACVGVIGFLQGKELLLMIETSIALAVAAIPEGLPIVATIALAQGMLQMAKQNALINKLSSVETLGSTNVIFSDKTGTLTLNKMQVTRINLQSGTFKFFSENQQDEKRSKDNQDFLSKKDEDVMEALKIGVLCNNASLSTDNNEESVVGDPLEVALLDAGKKVDLLRDELIKQLPEKREVAFDPELKMMATVHKENNSFYIAVKGAPEAVLEHSSSIKKDNGSTFTEDDKEGWLEKNQEMAEDGLRVLAVAFKKATEENIDVYENLTFIGLLGLLDPPRKEVKEYIEACQNAGIRLIMVTGDHPATAQNVAKEISLIDEDKDQVMLGKDLGPDESLSEDKKSQIIQHSLFARVSPEQKLDLISIYQNHGFIVAMTGDGVNDAPALKKADIGIAMGKRGTQVAKDASDMVLQDDSFSSIITAIKHGRIIFSNIRKFILFLLSGNIGEITAVAFASLVNYPLPISPLQILYVNLILDVFPALALGIGRGDSHVMKESPRDPEEPFLMKKHWILIILYGIIIASSIFLSLFISLNHFQMPVKKAVTISFLTLTFARLGHVFNMRTYDSSFIINEVTKNKYVWGALALCITLILAAVYLPGLSNVLQTVDPGITGWLLIILMSSIPFMFGQIGLELWKKYDSDTSKLFF